MWQLLTAFNIIVLYKWWCIGLQWTFFFTPGNPGQMNQPSPSVIKCFLFILLQCIFHDVLGHSLYLLFFGMKLKANFVIDWRFGGFSISKNISFSSPSATGNDCALCCKFSVVDVFLWAVDKWCSPGKYYVTCTFYKVFIHDTLTCTTIFINF